MTDRRAKESEAERKLTAKQEMFCKEYIIDLHGTKAAIRAGYSEKTANVIAAQNLTKLNIMARITELSKSRLERVEISADYVLSSLKLVADRCMQAEQVKDEDGNVVEFKFEHSGANKSLELLGKHLKLFSDKLDIGNADGVAFNMNFSDK